MNNSSNSRKTKSSSPEDDAIREERKLSRVNKVHGGELVEAVSPEELVSVNDADCRHENMIRDESETEFNAFMCANPNCSVVAIVDRV